jgi:CxxC motif-containing protein
MNYIQETGKLTGNKCPRGESYAKAYDPNSLEIKTFQILLENGYTQHLTVATDQPVTSALVERIDHALRTARITAPVERGEIVLTNIAGTGINLLSSRKMPARR